MKLSKEDALTVMENSGRKTINQAALYMELHFKAAGDYVEHAKSCDECSQKVGLIKAMLDLETEAAAAIEALRDFAVALETAKKEAGLSAVVH